MAFRFIHTADVHLDSPLRSLALRDVELAELIGNATRRSFEIIVDLCLEERVDALMIAGDLYDGDQTSMKTALFIAGQFRRLNEAEIQVFVVRGNHDALSKITKELILPDNVRVFGGRSEIVEIDHAHTGVAIAVHGISFAKPHAPESLIRKFKAPIEGAFNIGLLHTSLAGSADHDDYAPCSVAELAATGIDYWCLGHIHKRTVHSETPTIVMPGIPQGRDINEAGAKSLTLATVADDRSVSIEERLTSVAQFERVPVDLSGVEDWRDMVLKIEANLQRSRDKAASEHLVVRLHLQGNTTLAWRLRRDQDLAKTEAENRAATLGNTWIEKIEIDTLPPEQKESDRSFGPVSDLAAMMTGSIIKSDDYRKAAADLVDELHHVLPRDVRDVLGHDPTSRDKIMARLAAEGCEEVLARISDGLSEELSD